MQVVIVGANFGNKGAQSMLFTTVAVLRRNYPDARIIFAHRDKNPVLNGKFLLEEVYLNKYRLKVSSDVVDINIPKEASWGSGEKTIQAIKNADLIVDISGFVLGSKWGVAASRAYLKVIKLARKFNVPMILMPQSFGPFDFGKNQESMDAAIADAMAYPKKIFAREHDGFVSLREKYKLKNVQFHPDIVLSSPKIDLADIYKEVPKITVPKVLSSSCVGIVPNMRSFDHGGNPWQTIQTFYEIINFLLQEGKLVYLFRHSREDIIPCQWLKSLFADDERVILWKESFSCFEYDEVCRQFEFLIIGRFHGIVHAYRNNIPCLLMGWAVKYRELAQLMYQSKYVFDLSSSELNTSEIFSAIRDMDANLELNKKILRGRLEQLERNSTCFSAMTDILDKVGGRYSK